MQAEVTTVFSELSMTAMVILSLYPCNVPNDLFQALCKAPKVEEEITKTAGSCQSQSTESCRDILRVLNGDLVSWMACNLEYLYSKCCQDPVIEAVICELHGAIQESHQILACGALVVIVAQHHLAASAFRVCMVLTPGYPLLWPLSLWDAVYALRWRWPRVARGSWAKSDSWRQLAEGCFKSFCFQRQPAVPEKVRTPIETPPPRLQLK